MNLVPGDQACRIQHLIPALVDHRAGRKPFVRTIYEDRHGAEVVCWQDRRYVSTVGGWKDVEDRNGEPHVV